MARLNPRSAAGVGRSIAAAKTRATSAPRQLGATALAADKSARRRATRSVGAHVANLVKAVKTGKISERTAARASGRSLGKFRKTTAQSSPELGRGGGRSASAGAARGGRGGRVNAGPLIR